jgi:hypothetical protein
MMLVDPRVRRLVLAIPDCTRGPLSSWTSRQTPHACRSLVNSWLATCVCIPPLVSTTVPTRRTDLDACVPMWKRNSGFTRAGKENKSAQCAARRRMTRTAFVGIGEG